MALVFNLKKKMQKKKKTIKKKYEYETKKKGGMLLSICILTNVFVSQKKRSIYIK
jgi:hypothetical protein